MKKIIYLSAFMFFSIVVFSQNKIRDGIYLVDEDGKNYVSEKFEKAYIQFNPQFVDEALEEYEPVTVITNDFVVFELTTMPFIQYQQREGNLVIHLTKDATANLSDFTSRNMLNNVAVVVNGEVLAIYKVTQPVKSEFVQISKCNGDACADIYSRLKASVKK